MDLLKEKNYIYKAILTFVQTFLANVLVLVPMIDWSEPKIMLKATLLSIITSSISAGVMAVINKKEEVV